MKAEAGFSSRAESEGPSKVRRILPWALGVAALTLAAIVAVLIHGYRSTPGWVGVSGKKFWDYLELLIVPAALAIGVALLNWAQRQRERQAEDAQQELQLAVEDQRAQDEALQAYLDQMGQLLLDKDRPLRQSAENSEVRTLARARTLTVLARLKGKRKNAVMQFLYESGLITRDHNLIDLTKADLNEADLSGALLRSANLCGANLFRANLEGAILEEADLEDAQLQFANLRGANLKSAKLRRADLSKADLSRQWGTFSPADPEDAYLMPTSLFYADLTEVTLKGADLTGAAGFTNEELVQLLRSEADKPDKAFRLEGATMPNGQKYEDWLKDKEGPDEEEENSGSS